ncbi:MULTISPECIES: DUF5702 domain-containing protein [Bacillaceae]|nr:MULTISPECIES: DUF5702 domain-containing protein [Bacillaceae]
MIHKFKTDKKGSVSIFFIIIITAIFFFNAVLIDYARILSAEKQTEYAVQSAVRSAMAGFDNNLKDNYGLFGIKDGQIGDFEEFLEKNLEAPEGDFEFINLMLEDFAHEFEARELANPAILEHQILEEMKYKAPVEIVINLIDKFASVSSAMKETSTFIKTAEDIQGKFEDREKALNEAAVHLAKIRENLDRLIGADEDTDGYVNKPSTEPDFPTVGLYNDIIYHFENDYLDDVALENRISEIEAEIEEWEELEAETEEEQEDIDQEIEELRDEIDELTENKEQFEENAQAMLDTIYDLTVETESELENALSKIETAESINDSMRNVIESNRAASESNYGNAENNAGTISDPDQASEMDQATAEIQQMADRLDEYLYNEVYALYNEENGVNEFDENTDFFGSMKQFLNQAIANFDGTPELLEPVVDFFEGTDAEALRDLQLLLRNRMFTTESQVDEARTFFSRKRMDFPIKQDPLNPTADPEDFDEDAKREEADAENEAAQDALEEAMEIAEGLAGEQGIYDALQDFLEELESFEIVDPDDVESVDLSGSSGGSARSAMELVDTIFREMGNILEAARNELFINEYILMYFESKEPATGQNDFKFEKREVEYILYGIHEPGLNYAAAMSQLFAIRFALNFIASFKQIEVRSAGHPLAVFIAALGWSLKETIFDMTIVTGGGSVSLIHDIVELDTTYHDYLRLFLFMNPGGDNRMRRMMAVMNHHGIDLRDKQTYIKGNVESSVNLLFIPELAQLMGTFGVLDGRVDENKRYRIEKEAHFSY